MKDSWMGYISVTGIPHCSALYLAVQFCYTGLVYLSFFLCFSKLRKATVCLSALTNSAPNGWIFIKFEIWLFFLKSAPKKIPASLKADKSNGHFTWRPLQICDNIYLNSPLNEKYFRQVVEKIKPHIFVQ